MCTETGKLCSNYVMMGRVETRYQTLIWFWICSFPHKVLSILVSQDLNQRTKPVSAFRITMSKVIYLCGRRVHRPHCVVRCTNNSRIEIKLEMQRRLKNASAFWSLPIKRRHERFKVPFRLIFKKVNTLQIVF